MVYIFAGFQNVMIFYQSMQAWSCFIPLYKNIVRMKLKLISAIQYLVVSTHLSCLKCALLRLKWFLVVYKHGKLFCKNMYRGQTDVLKKQVQDRLCR